MSLSSVRVNQTFCVILCQFGRNHNTWYAKKLAVTLVYVLLKLPVDRGNIIKTVLNNVS